LIKKLKLNLLVTRLVFIVIFLLNEKTLNKIK
jgi:hypothetical protein